MDPQETAIRQAIVECYGELNRRGMNAATSGNVSVRFGAGMIITPSGAAGDEIAPQSLVITGLDGGYEASSDRRRLSSEWAMHAAVYRRCPTAGAVVHGHPDAAVALASLRQGLPAFHYMVGGFGGDDVPCVGYLMFGSPELGDAAGAALAERTACLLANHGMLARGRTLGEAFETAVTLEALARQYLMARAAGEPVLLTPDEIAEGGARYRDYGRNVAGAYGPGRWSVP